MELREGMFVPVNGVSRERSKPLNTVVWGTRDGVLQCKEVWLCPILQRNNWREREIPGNRAVLTLLVNVLAFFIVHPWKQHCYKISLLVFASRIRSHSQTPPTVLCVRGPALTGLPVYTRYDDCESTPLHSCCPQGM